LILQIALKFLRLYHLEIEEKYSTLQNNLRLSHGYVTVHIFLESNMRTTFLDYLNVLQMTSFDMIRT